ncbi:hypothetical protein ACODT5_18765 [Streptomyces sp. 5.8]|uniref:hypothetical protein n=1 Tax=Streptomyces sp. 5.8 TaxID=3406571 RepID=UPI003BB6677E
MGSAFEWSADDVCSHTRRTPGTSCQPCRIASVDGQGHAYGPAFEVLEAAVNASFAEGATGIIDSVERAPAGE